MATSTLGSGTLVLAGTTSGTTTVTATAVAGTTTLTLPAATDTLVGRATTDTLTNKTLTGAAMNGTLGATTASTVAATTLTTSSTVTHNGGTANGVAFLNGSKVLTTGSALVFDGTGLVTINGGSGANGTLRLVRSGGFPGDFSILAGGQSATTNFLLYDNTNAQNAYFYLGGASGYHAWYQNGTEALRLTSTSLYTASTINVGIGTSSPATKLHVNTGAAGYGITIAANSQTSITYQLGIDSNSNFAVYDTSSAVQRLTLDTSGNLLINTTTSVGGAARIGVLFAGNATNGINIQDSTTTSGAVFQQFSNSAGTSIGNIARVTTTNAVTYNQTSDYRLKTVTGAVTGQGSRIDALKPIDYLWTEGNQQARGFLAHEFQTVYPNSVTGDKDAVDANGNPKYQSMQASTSEVIADLVAEIQDLRKRLAAAGI